MSDPTQTGISADLTRVVDISRYKGSQPEALAKGMRPLERGLREQGYVWFRVTAPADDPNHIYLEAWLYKPMIEGKLNREVAVRVR